MHFIISKFDISRNSKDEQSLNNPLISITLGVLNEDKFNDFIEEQPLNISDILINDEELKFEKSMCNKLLHPFKNLLILIIEDESK